MTTTTSQVHSEAVSGWSPIGPLVSGMGGSLAFTILTGLAERLVLSLPSAFRTGYGPRCLSAQGQSRDLQHLAPMLTRCGNSALRDMAHMGVCPIQSNVPHSRASFSRETPGGVGSFYNGWQTATSLQSSIGPGKLPREARSLIVGQAVWGKQSFPGSGCQAGISLPALSSKGLGK